MKKYKVEGDQAEMIQMMEPKFIELEESKVIGITAYTTNAAETGGKGKIPGLWMDYYQQRVAEKIPNQVTSSPTIGLYTDYEDGVAGTYLTLVGLKVHTIEEIPEGLEGKTIPAGRYAVFTTRRGPLSKVVPEGWVFIWNWFSRNDQKRTFTGDFELYDDRASNPDDVIVEIYIAVE